MKNEAVCKTRRVNDMNSEISFGHARFTVVFFCIEINATFFTIILSNNKKILQKKFNNKNYHQQNK